METKLKNPKPRIEGGSTAATRPLTHPLSLSARLYGPVLAVKGSASPRAWGLAVYEGKGGTCNGGGISTRTRLHKRAILQPSGTERAFKGLGIAKRGDSFVQC